MRLRYVILLSLALRLIAWTVVCRMDVPPIWDEVWYLSRGVAYGRIVTGYVSGPPASNAVYARAYGEGAWPPLHPVLLGLAFAVFGPSLAIARLVVVLQSTVTTAVVYFLTARLANRRAALAAAALHAVYPSFVAYSHYVLSETTYILTWLTALYFILQTVREEHPAAWMSSAVLAGIFLGLAGLTRATALPLLSIVPLWCLVARQPIVRRLAAICTLYAVSAVVVAPWLVTLHAREHRFVPLATNAGLNLYMGNHPGGWSPLKWIQHPRIEGAIAEYATAHGLNQDDAARAMAWAYIRDDPRGAVRRALGRLRAVWLPDQVIVRNLLNVAYPPLPLPVAALVWAGIVCSFLVFVACVLAGLFGPTVDWRHRIFLVTCVVLAATPYLLTNMTSRRALPLWATVLPLAGAGIASVVVRRRSRAAAGWLAFAMLGYWGLYRSAPQMALGLTGTAASYYSPLLRHTPYAEALVKDRLFLRYTGEVPGQSVHLQLLSEPYQFDPSPNRDDPDPRSFTWKAQPRSMLATDLWADHIEATPPAVAVRVFPSGAATILRPVESNAWRHWQPTQIDGIDYAWTGADAPFDEEMKRRLQ